MKNVIIHTAHSVKGKTYLNDMAKWNAVSDPSFFSSLSTDELHFEDGVSGGHVPQSVHGSSKSSKS